MAASFPIDMIKDESVVSAHSWSDFYQYTWEGYIAIGELPSRPVTGSVPRALFSAKGDLLVGLQNGIPVAVPVGSNGTVLVADSTSSTGVTWGTAASGPAGADGLSILNGAGAPSSGTGLNGEFYVDNTNKLLYGPKTAGAWGAGFSLIGPAGTNGKNVLNGAGSPNSGVGLDGEFYIDTTNKLLYGPKAAGAWGSGTSLIGTAGTNGKNVLNGSGVPSSGTGVDGEFYIDNTNKILYGPKTAGAWGAGASIVGPAGAAFTARGVSTTSLAIAIASKAFTLTAMPVAFPVGTVVKAASDADPTNYMVGVVTASSTTTCTINVTEIGGSGTKADWTLTVGAFKGATGATGAQGSANVYGPAGSVPGPYSNGTVTYEY